MLKPLLLALACLSSSGALAQPSPSPGARSAPGKTWTYLLAEDGSRVSLAWGTGAELAPGHAWHQDGRAVSGVLSLPLTGDFSLHANLGAAKARWTGQRNQGWALVLAQTGEHGTSVMAELFDDERTLGRWAQAGVRWTSVPGRVSLDARYGRSMSEPGEHALTLGTRIAF